jgi:hypothetical protein
MQCGSRAVACKRLGTSTRTYDAFATTAAALVRELRTALRRATFVSVMEAANLGNGGDSPEWWADRP